jgi:hypothetical protein
MLEKPYRSEKIDKIKKIQPIVVKKQLKAVDLQLKVVGIICQTILGQNNFVALI